MEKSNLPQCLTSSFTLYLLAVLIVFIFNNFIWMYFTYEDNPTPLIYAPQYTYGCAIISKPQYSFRIFFNPGPNSSPDSPCHSFLLHQRQPFIFLHFCGYVNSGCFAWTTTKYMVLWQATFLFLFKRCPSSLGTSTYVAYMNTHIHTNKQNSK